MLRMLMVLALTLVVLASTEKLQSADWPTVYRAAEELEALGGEAIPDLLQLMGDDRKVKLTGTADLIYPGADRFYGHGYVVNYDLDWLPVRAGWVLERITFKSFGFREQGDVPRRKLTAEERLEARRKASDRARTWWAGQGSWQRRDALLEALRSTDSEREQLALEYLRFGKTPCAGLDEPFYRQQLRPEIERLSKSGNRAVQAQATHLLKDAGQPWKKP